MNSSDAYGAHDLGVMYRDDLVEIDEIFKFLAPLTVGFVAAYVGSLLALRKFKREKIWDERRAIYKEVIESLEEIVFWCEYVRATHCCEPVIESDVDFDSSLRNIARHSVSGGLFSSCRFQEVLEQANAELYRVRFQIKEESMPDLDSDYGRDE